ncbi:MAG: sensor histidine kinase [Gammaproteobacteria bacterium]|nr:sensor histidine kinase [Gammaproteobacteria bacterium]NIR85548.1 sensor histidine kinase [Gammaproteobacteria bacterium]NIR89807.1 sensor histidine kinase [Gammaproteobacteria bacterium]NIU06683.1 sensor histidine kinase [Gammaproteobacteria bacterium]NIV75074.1 sensor histidine kinase [Gammaproteobacteria bacterium]
MKTAAPGQLGAEQGAPDPLFLPDFCGIRTVFAVVVMGEMLAFVLALAGADNRWSSLALISLFIQWVGLSSAALLCACRRWLSLLENVAAGFVSYALILLVTLVLSEAAYWLVEKPLALPGAAEGWHQDFLLRNLAVSAIVGAVALRYLYVQHQWKINLESESRARIQALQSRIRPHFLFNCMNTIANLTRSQPALAEEVIEDLADLFRVSLSDASVPTQLARELEVCRQYLRIEGLRLGNRLAVEWHTDGLPGDALLPALTVQPLLENAIHHGIEPQPQGGLVRLVAERHRDSLRLSICNSVPSSEEGPGPTGNRLAQDNVRQRLHAFFRGRGTLRVEPAEGEYRVHLDFPYVTTPP